MANEVKVPSKVLARDYTSEFLVDLVWNTRDEMIKWIRNRGKELMMILVIENSNSSRVRISCEHYGEYRRKNYEVRGNSKKINCPFMVEGFRLSRDKKTMEEKWGDLTVVDGHHNHDIATTFEGHSFMGRMTLSEKETVRRWTNMRMNPRKIQEELQAIFPENVTSIKQINNFQQKMRSEDLGELTVTQWTLNFLIDKEYKVFTKKDKLSSEVDILMFANPTSLHLLKLFPYVVIIDATYKTNRYNMHLVEMVGFSSTGKTFNIAFAFTKGEDLSHYTFILQRLKRLYALVGRSPTCIVTDRDYPLINAIGQVFGDSVKHLLCWVHIKQNIRAHALLVLKDIDVATKFAHRCWGIFLSSTVDIYSKRLEWLKKDWGSGLVGYVEKTWFNPFKENIVRAWTDRHLHFITRTTNRVEGMHKKLKDDLESCRYGFNSIIMTIHNSLKSQCRNIKASMEMSRMKVPSEVRDLAPFIQPLFAPLHNKITEKCFKMLLDMYYAILRGEIKSDCTDYWWRACQGMPCKHRIANAMLDNIPIEPSELHLFWRQVKWEGVTDEYEDETVPLAAHHIVIREMISDYTADEMGEDNAFEVASLYETLKRPSKTPLTETKGKPKGRPKGATGSKWNNIRSPSHIEHVAKKNKRKTPSTQTKECLLVSSESNRKANEGNDTPHVSDIWVEHWGIKFPPKSLDSFMFSFIVNAEDVMADGHCGYRSLAVLLGWSEIEYALVRMDIFSELLKNKEIYCAIKPAITSYEILCEQVNYYTSPCSNHYWMSMPIPGLAFATHHGIALVLLSWNGPCLCLPMKASLTNNKPPTKVMCIALLENHFIPMWLTDDAPLPPPPRYWFNFKDPSVDGWESGFEDRIEKWRSHRRASGRSPDLIFV